MKGKLGRYRDLDEHLAVWPIGRSCDSWARHVASCDLAASTEAASHALPQTLFPMR
jgi:hypothetical protein